MDRAPRLRPDQRIAQHVTRVGRFRKLDPRHGRPPPSLPALAGRLGWGLLVAGSFRRAVKGLRGQEDVGVPAPAAPAED